MKIADLFFASHLDDTGLLKDVQQSGDKAGHLFGSRMSGALSLALRGGLGVVAGGAAIAVRGLQELDDITAKFTAETGASAAEAKRAGEAINEMAGRNLQPLSEIGDTLIKVHTDMGLTGAAAEKLTEQFLKYATATGQNAADAVKHFDDILDAWGLTAADAQGVMDKLIASHQKYGGSLEENEQALKNFAPQLKALNATIDDGIGLLNLFATAGLDAESATRALNTAVSKLKPGQSLNDLVAQIIKIKDPTDRAKKAIELFGAKGGVALANALRPGIGGLKDFEISAQDAAGATQKASDAIEGTFGNRIKLAIKAVGSEIIGLGQDFGPVLSGLAGLATLGGSLGLDRLIAKGWKGVASSGLVRGAAREAGLLIGTIYGAAAGLASKIAEVAAEKWNEVLQSSAVKLLASKAGAVVGAIYGAALGAAAKIGEALATAIGATPFSGALRTAVLEAALIQGGAFGTAFAAAAAAAIVAAPVAVLVVALKFQSDIDKQGDSLLAQAKEFVKVATNGDLQNAIAATEADLAQIPGNAFDAKNKVIAVLNTLIAEQNRRLTDGGAVGGEKYGDAMVAAFRKSSPGLAIAAKTGTEKAGDAMVAAWKQSLHGLPPIGMAALQTIERLFESPAAITALKAAARRSALLVMGSWGKGFRDGRDQVDQAWQEMLDGLKHPASVTAETAKLLGRLMSKKLQEGIHSGDPAVKDQAQYTKQLIIDRLHELRPRAGTLGKQAMNELRAAMKSKDPDIRAAAWDIYNAVNHPISQLPGRATTVGTQIGHNLGTAMQRAIANFQFNFSSLFSLLDAARQDSQHRAAGGPVEAGVPYTVGEFRPETFIPRVPGYVLPFELPHIQASAASSGGETVNQTFNVTVNGSPTTPPTPFETARQLRRAVGGGGFVPRRRPGWRPG